MNHVLIIIKCMIYDFNLLGYHINYFKFLIFIDNFIKILIRNTISIRLEIYYLKIKISILIKILMII